MPKGERHQRRPRTCKFYGLADSPFKPTPNPRYFYLSPGHREALASILYHIHGHYGIVVIKLQRPELRQFSQRISRMPSIGALNEIHTYRYIQHRMHVAGYSGPLVFESRALKLIWRYSRGIPRLINKLCDNALLLNYMSGSRLVPAAVIREVAGHFGLKRPRLDWRLRQPVAPGWLRRDNPAAG